MRLYKLLKMIKIKEENDWKNKKQKRWIFAGRNIDKYVYIFCARVCNFCISEADGYYGKG